MDKAVARWGNGNVVRFDIYCNLCKHRDKSVRSELCYSCRTKSDWYKPVKFEGSMEHICERR